MENDLYRAEGEYPSYPSNKKEKAAERWMDKDMKEFYFVRIGGD